MVIRLTLGCKKNLGHIGAHLIPIFREGVRLKNKKKSKFQLHPRKKVKK